MAALCATVFFVSPALCPCYFFFNLFIYVCSLQHECVNKGEKKPSHKPSKGDKTFFFFLENYSVFILTEQNGYFHVLKEYKRLLFQGAERCMTIFCCYVTVQIKAN